MDVKNRSRSDKWVKSTCNLTRAWRYQNWNSFLTPWYVGSFGSTSRRSNVKVKVGSATGKAGVGVGIKVCGEAFYSVRDLIREVRNDRQGTFRRLFANIYVLGKYTRRTTKS